MVPKTISEFYIGDLSSCHLSDLSNISQWGNNKIPTILWPWVRKKAVPFFQDHVILDGADQRRCKF